MCIRDRLHPVPENLPDEAAVLIEPAACAVHAALSRLHAGSTQAGEDLTAVVIGAGTLGLCVIAALSRFREDVTRVIAVAKHPHQRELANRLGATSVAEPGELRRAVRRATGSWALGSGQLSGGAPLVIDCVGTASSIADALAVTAPGGDLAVSYTHLDVYKRQLPKGQPRRLDERRHRQQQAVSAQTVRGWPGCRPSSANAQGQARRTGRDRNGTGLAGEQLSLHEAAKQIARVSAPFLAPRRATGSLFAPTARATRVPEQPGPTW